MRFLSLLAVALFCLLLGCGYVGPVVPPSPEIPYPITDLAVVERGDQLIVTFTTPSHTIDALPIRQFSDVDLRVGPSVTPFDFGRWAEEAKRYDRPLSNDDNDPDNPQPKPVRTIVPVSEWQGKKIDVAVRASVRKGEHYSQWSNRVSLDVIPPLSAPRLNPAEATREGYKLTWPEEVSGTRYDVLRQGPGDKTLVTVGVAEKPEYVDTTSQWDTPYTYEVVAKKGSAESPPSNTIHANNPDTFAPSVPTSVVALAGPDSVELTWARSPEADTKGYYVYRSTNGGPFERQGALVAIPTFSDRKVEHGKTYRYTVRAVDGKNNISENSAPPAEVAF